MPPPSVRISGLKLSALKSSLFIKALNRVLRPGKIWNGYFCSSFTKAGISRGFGMRILRAPSLMPIIAFTVRAKM
ncbi:hypothetical protein FQZ97_1049350 [compost metagenome]